MTNIPHVNIWMEAEAFFDSITDADRTLRIVAGDGGGRVRREAPPTLHVSRSIGRQHIKVPAIRSSSRAWSRDRMTRFTPRLLIAAIRCDAPAYCGAFADARRIVAGDGGGRVRTRNARPVRSGSAAPTTARRAVSSPGVVLRTFGPNFTGPLWIALNVAGRRTGVSPSVFELGAMKGLHVFGGMRALMTNNRFQFLASGERPRRAIVGKADHELAGVFPQIGRTCQDRSARHRRLVQCAGMGFYVPLQLIVLAQF